MLETLENLARRLDRATGGDADLDQSLAEALGQPLAAFSEDADQARALAAHVLNGWRLHVGYGVSGVFPYARLTSGAATVSAEAGTVPLAILKALIAALRT